MSLFKKDKTEPEITTWAEVRSPDVRSVDSDKKERTVALKSEERTTILGKGSEFEGKLQFEGTLCIEGVFSGEILSETNLEVKEGAKVNAEIDIGTIIVNGEVKGNIRANQGVEIRSSGKLFGNIETPSLFIEKGAIFEGSSKMQNLGKKPPPALVKEQKPPAALGENKK